MWTITSDNYKNVKINIASGFEDDVTECEMVSPEGETVSVSVNNVKELFSHKRSSGIEYDRMFYLVTKADSLGIKLNEYSTGRILKKEHSGNVDKYVENYKKLGNTKCLEFPSDWSKEALVEEFGKIRRFNGRTPRILDVMASVSDKYGIEPKDIATKFDIELVGALRNAGVPDAEVVLLYTHLPKEHLVHLKDKPALCCHLANFISKGILDREDKLLTIAEWVAAHYNTDKEVLDNLLDSPYSFRIGTNTSVEKVKVQCGGLKAKDEIKKLEKAYKKPNFKFSECVCNLTMSSAETEKYKSYILEGDDPRQVILGHETNCCQVYGDAGETAMLHGLLNPNAGFWVVVDAETDKLRCQAEVWEYDEETLVFDNIEFADDTEIDRYKEIIGEWLLHSPYKNVVMGCGYNELSYSPFEVAPNLVPPVTPREIYVMSYEEDAEVPDFYDRTAPNKRTSDREKDILKLKSEEEAKQMLEEGRIDYYDYLYSDVDDGKGMVWLKQDFRIADYFGITMERQEEQKSQFLDVDKESRLEKYAMVIANVLSKER